MGEGVPNLCICFFLFFLSIFLVRFPKTDVQHLQRKVKDCHCNLQNHHHNHQIHYHHCCLKTPVNQEHYYQLHIHYFPFLFYTLTGYGCRQVTSLGVCWLFFPSTTTMCRCQCFRSIGLFFKSRPASNKRAFCSTLLHCSACRSSMTAIS